MRLSVFIADTLSAQLLIDLQKIYENTLPEKSLTTQALSNEIIESASQLFVTMFNERHLGAVKVSIDTTKATLSQLCIRDITRRRGIGKNLLKQIEKQLVSNGIQSIQYDLAEVPAHESLSTQAFLSNSGYFINANIATKQL